ncbi:MAG: class I SAM-dependent methyltransferase [Desulfurococcales archaeon]|nr:class I SAM-dependent methyltransferase [Desulfurococcales archaeon]
MSKSNGLGDIWREVVESIEELSLSGCYERVNKILSLGMLNRLRKRTAELVGGPVIVDAGAGPGTSTRIVIGVHPYSKVLMVDPSGHMLSHALSRLPSGRVAAVLGRFESLPLADNSVDGIVAMFSFRDAIDYGLAAREFSRVLKRGGSVAILDFYKPMQPFKAILKTYLAIMVPIAAALAGCIGKVGMYRSFLETIDRMLTYNDIKRLFSKYFRTVEIKRIVPGLAIISASTPRSVNPAGDGASGSPQP